MTQAMLTMTAKKTEEIINYMAKVMEDDREGIQTYVKTINGTSFLTLRGIMYKAQINFSLLTATTRELCIQTPTDADILWAKDTIASDKSGITYKLLEGTTWTGTVAHNATNMNRQSVNEHASLLFNTVTGYSNVGATQIDLFVLLGGAGVGQSQYGSMQTSDEFMILKRNTKYTLEITNNSGETANLFVKSLFAEILL